MLNGRKQLDQIKEIKDTKLEDDDVIICAYPKCGTHWLWEVMEMLKSGVIQYNEEVKETRMLEFIFKEGIEGIPAPRVFNTHMPLRMLPTEAVEKKVKCFQIMRNPKDVCVSWFHHLRNATVYEYEGDFKEFTETFLTGELPFGSYHEYLQSWNKEIAERKGLPSMCLRYEDMKRDPIQCVRNIADFLQVEVSDKQCQDIAEACSFKKLKKADTELKTGLDDNFEQLWKEGSGGTFYRKGEVGDWKNWFTVAESEKFDQIWNEKMKNLNIKFTYS